MFWNNHKKDVPNGTHAFLSPSSHSWYNYDDEKMAKVYGHRLAASRGTAMHELACKLIKMRVKLPNDGSTLSMYVNDAIDLDMDPEVPLFYSKFCFGTADTISVKDNFVRIHDYKSGEHRASMMQLKIYLALFFLEYEEFKIRKVKGMEVRIYQNNEVRVENPEIDEIVPIMDKIIHFDKMLERLEERYDEGFGS